MRPARAVGYSVAGIIVVTAVVILVTHRLGVHNHGSMAATISSAPRTTAAAPYPTAIASETVSTAASKSLINQVTDFLEAYYLIKPDDTAASRQARMAPLVSAGFLEHLDLGLASGTAADRARQGKITVQAKVMTDQFVAEPLTGDSSELTVTVPVTITDTTSNNSAQSFEVITTSTWKQQDTSWSILAFSEGGDTG
ncbi:MAG TPA: hypothetical protein VHD60_02515 [Candidatus Saccharimonadales bacterium]|nr:hypothetical protein [Candidatus Saccharimonadales bacterium]